MHAARRTQYQRAYNPSARWRPRYALGRQATLRPALPSRDGKFSPTASIIDEAVIAIGLIAVQRLYMYNT
eukprot:6178425-Pleurochrysis_carterae.AAC.1